MNETSRLSVGGGHKARSFGSFLEVVASPEEVVLGIAGRFWRPDGGIVRDLTPEGFREFRRMGYAKAVWNFFISPADGSSRLAPRRECKPLDGPPP